MPCSVNPLTCEGEARNSKPEDNGVTPLAPSIVTEVPGTTLYGSMMIGARSK